MKKILIIDDQKDNLVSVKALLKNYIPGCKLFTALSGQEGIEVAIKEQPDTILLDIIMPGIDGFETCKKLKKNKSTNHIPIIMLTAIKTDPASRVKGLDSGADAFLSKPIDPTELSAQVNVMLRIKEAEDKLRAEKELLDEKVEERTKELREREHKYKILINNLPGFVYRRQNDKKRTMIYISAACKNITGYLPKDFIHNKNIAFNDIIEPAFQQKVFNKWNEVLAKKTIFEFEYPIITKNKNIRWMWEKGCGIYSDEGKPLFLEGFITDITESKQAEDNLKKKMNELQIFYDATINREIKMLELKKEINKLLEDSGAKPKYEIPT